MLKRGLDQKLDTLIAAVEEMPVKQTMYYRRAVGEITQSEFKSEFADW